MEEREDIISEIKEKTLPPLTDDCLMPIGKHKGKMMKDVPVEYYAWMVQEYKDAPRVSRGTGWLMVMEWIKSKG
jgi:uncharacterized protein (DUF3820 family)